MIPLFKPYMSPTAIDRVGKVLYSGWITEGPEVAEFEAQVGAYLKAKNVLAVNSGTSALQLALYLAGVRPGSWVISTPMTCTATNTAILAMGGRILWADIDPATGNIDPAAVLILVWCCPVTAVVAVDWAGVPCDYRELRMAAGNIPIVRDAAHAFGSAVNAEPDFTCYSFQAIKHLTTGDGGAVVCRSDEDHERGRLLRWFGLDRRQDREQHVVREAGWKYHMNDITAAIGLANLPDVISTILPRHRRNGRYYDAHLGIVRPDWCDPAYWVYPMIVPDRDAFRAGMTERGIATSTVHTRNDAMPGFAGAVTPADGLPGVDEFAAHQVNIPCGWWVGDSDAEHIIQSAKELL